MHKGVRRSVGGILLQHGLLFCLTSMLFSQCSSQETFHCGSDQIQNGLASAIVQINCKHRVSAINKCCVEHDVCYDQQRGRDQCDGEFCRCAKKASASDPLCTFYTNTFCDVVKVFGELAYANSAKVMNARIAAHSHDDQPQHHFVSESRMASRQPVQVVPQPRNSSSSSEKISQVANEKMKDEKPKEGEDSQKPASNPNGPSSLPNDSEILLNSETRRYSPSKEADAIRIQFWNAEGPTVFLDESGLKPFSNTIRYSPTKDGSSLTTQTFPPLSISLDNPPSSISLTSSVKARVSAPEAPVHPIHAPDAFGVSSRPRVVYDTLTTLKNEASSEAPPTSAAPSFQDYQKFVDVVPQHPPPRVEDIEKKRKTEEKKHDEAEKAVAKQPVVSPAPNEHSSEQKEDSSISEEESSESEEYTSEKSSQEEDHSSERDLSPETGDFIRNNSAPLNPSSQPKAIFHAMPKIAGDRNVTVPTKTSLKEVDYDFNHDHGVISLQRDEFAGQEYALSSDFEELLADAERTLQESQRKVQDLLHDERTEEIRESLKRKQMKEELRRKREEDRKRKEERRKRRERKRIARARKKASIAAAEEEREKVRRRKDRTVERRSKSEEERERAERSRHKQSRRHSSETDYSTEQRDKGVDRKKRISALHLTTAPISTVKRKHHPKNPRKEHLVPREILRELQRDISRVKKRKGEESLSIRPSLPNEASQERRGGSTVVMVHNWRGEQERKGWNWKRLNEKARLREESEEDISEEDRKQGSAESRERKKSYKKQKGESSEDVSTDEDLLSRSKIKLRVAHMTPAEYAIYEKWRKTLVKLMTSSHEPTHVSLMTSSHEPTHVSLMTSSHEPTHVSQSSEENE